MADINVLFAIAVILGKGVIIGLFVLCIWYTFQEGEIFEFVSAWGQEHIPDKWQNPVYECNVCMTPWYGSVLYWLLTLFWGGHVVEWILTIVVAMGVNIAINKLAPPDGTEDKPIVIEEK